MKAEQIRGLRVLIVGGNKMMSNKKLGFTKQQISNMREIKFRAWNWKEKEMGWVAILDIGGGWVTVGVDPDLQENSVGCDQQAVDWDIQYVKLMQFTGLKDKRGKEIFEGDITESNNGRRWKIVWEDKGATFVMVSLELKNWVLEFEKYEADNCEVIGNIYETKK